MKITFSLLTMAILFFTIIHTAEAQRGNRNASPEARAEQQTALMKTQLSLSSKQAEKVQDVNLKYALKMKEMRDANTDGDWSTMRESAAVLRQEQNEELKSLLTTDQFEMWMKFVAEQRSKSGRKEKNGKDTPEDNQN